MKMLSIILTISIFTVACTQPDQQQLADAAERKIDFNHHCVYTDQFLDESNYWVLKSKEPFAKMVSALDLDTLKEQVNITLDDQQISYQKFMDTAQVECIPFGFFDHYNISTDTLNSTTYKRQLVCFTQAYYQDNLHEPEYLELEKGDNNMLYLSLSTPLEGSMIAIVFDRKTGKSIIPFYKKDFDGNFHLGHSAKDITSNELSIIFMIDKKIGHKHFTLEAAS